MTHRGREHTEPVQTVACVEELHATVDGHSVPAGLSFTQAILDCPLVAQQSSKSIEGRLAGVEESHLLLGEFIQRRVALR